MTDVIGGPRTVSAASVAERTEDFEPRVWWRLRDDLGFWLVIGGLVLSCFAGHWRDIGIPLPIDRGLLLAGLALECMRARRSGVLPRTTSAAVVLVAAAAWTAISWLSSAERSSGGFYFLLDLYLVPTVLFITAPIVFGTRRRRFVLAASFAVFGIYLGLVAITQTLDLPALVFPSYILDPSVGIHQDRARGPYVEAVNDGMMLIFSGALGAYVGSTAVARRWRVVGGSSAVLCGIGCALTLTRAIWLAGAAALLIALVSIPALRRRLPLVLVGLAVLAAGFLVAFPDFLAAATDRGEAKSPIWDRLDVAQGATAMGLQNPLFGVGWNQAGTRMIEFVRLGADYPVTAASAGLIPHNVFLSRFAELGIPGLALWLASLVAVLVLPVLRRGRPGFGGWRLVLLACALCWLIIANAGPVNYSEPQYLLYLIGGVAASGRALVPEPWDWTPGRGRAHVRAHRATAPSAEPALRRSEA